MGARRAQGLYRYSPSSDEQYFSSHYYLGHRRFETGEPELFLFGDLQDLNYLPPKPVKFPYKQPPKSQPLKTLRSFINIQRDSIKLVKANGSNERFRLQFTFDSDLPCQFTIFLRISDSVEVCSLKKHSSEAGEAASSVFKYGAGCEQHFTEEEYVIRPSDLLDEGYDPTNGHNTIPLAILMETDNLGAPETQQQAMLSLCTLDNFGEDNYSIKIIKQKLLAGGMELLLQELYGLENKQKPRGEEEEEEEAEVGGGEDGGKDSDSEGEDDLGAECVICITDIKDTLLLPCRHLCLCSSCAANLRFQASNCPICRAPFRALLQIRALEPLPPDVSLDDDTATGNPKYAVPGYKCVPLLQVLNGYQLEPEQDDDEDDEEGREKQRNCASESDTLQLAASPTTTEAVTEFCVIHIEDEPGQVTSEPVENPVRTMAKPVSSEPIGEVMPSKTIVLPGSPDLDHTSSMFADSDPNSDPQSSRCGSSISSEVSVKSTDALIISGKN